MVEHRGTGKLGAARFRRGAGADKSTDGGAWQSRRPAGEGGVGGDSIGRFPWLWWHRFDPSYLPSMIPRATLERMNGGGIWI